MASFLAKALMIFALLKVVSLEKAPSSDYISLRREGIDFVPPSDIMKETRNYPNTFTKRPLTPSYNVPGGTGSYPGTGSSQDRVAFSASRASAYTQHAPSQVRFDNTINDVGYGWDPREGIFSTYYPGLYVFSWTGVSPSNSQFRLTLMKNGREIAHAWSEEHGYQSGSNTITLALERNDRIALKITEGKVYEPSNSARGYTTFTGYKLN